MDAMRLDMWLDIACLYKTRSEAQTACKNGKIDVNGQTAKQNRILRAGDKLLISRSYGRKQQIVVKDMAPRHVSKAEARLLYDDVTPKPTAEEIEMRRMERIYRAQMTPPKAPDKRERRALRRLTGKD
jgi:ribosome-associated heat shock protein Hsp15